MIAAHPELAEVLDRHGLTLDPVSGEVVELERFNGVMSKRGEQVRKHLEWLEAEWEAAHPGEGMGPVVSARLAAKAWAHERPAKKPTTLHEEHDWVTELRDAGYDPETLRRPARRVPGTLDNLSVQTVASRALDRCAAGGSAWTRHTVQEHATRIMTEYGVQAAPEEIREFVGIATTLAMEDCFSILPHGAPTPEHVAHLTSLRVVQAETELRDLLAARVPKWEPRLPDVRDAAQVRGLDAGQERAAQVAHDELGVPATSVAALVHAHGWRWNNDGVWARLAPGDTDPETGRTYRGPSKGARLARGERVIVDEAGMLDQDTALALLTVTAETGATVALVGDRAQLAAFGRGGVLDMAAHIRGRTFDMAEVHRFTDPAYADLTLRMRVGRDSGEVFDQLAGLGLIRLHESGDDVHERIAQFAREGEAVTVSTNDEARTINARIREARVSQGLVDDMTTVYGSDGLPLGSGDVIQTRKNNAEVGVANRQQWVVQRVEDDGALSAREADSGRKRQRTVRLPADYVAEHAHLSYAATAYGVQGATVKGSHTILTDATSAASVYVGMTRGRNENALHIVAENLADARVQFIEAMERDRADRGLADATRRAVEEVAGLTEHGPVRFVSDEIAALVQRATTAEAQAARWQQVSTALADLSDRETALSEHARATEQTARQRAEQVRAEVTTPVVSAARTALTEWQQANAAEQAAGEQARTSSWFGKRRARDEHENAKTRTREAHQQLMSEWGELPRWNERADAWVERVTRPRIEHDPRVIETEQERQAARDALLHRPARAQTARLAAYARAFGAETVIRNQQVYLTANPAQQGARATKTAKQAREEAALLRSLTPGAAAERIKQTREAEAAHDAQRAKRERIRLHDYEQHRSTPRHDGTARGL